MKSVEKLPQILVFAMVILSCLKLVGFITLPWWVVLFPLVLMFAFICIVCVAILVIILVSLFRN